MYSNVHYPVAALAAGAVKSPGLCSIQYFKWEDALTWPEVDPETGMLSAAITLKPGKLLYLAESINPSRSFAESQKESLAGSYFDINVKCNLSGSTAAHPLTLGTMLHHQWGIIAADKNGVTRLIGNEDGGAKFLMDYSSGQGGDSRKTELIWNWSHSQPAPIYEADAFTIIIGGIIITAGCITFVQRFEVGAPGAPMNDGDLLYISALLLNKKALVIVDGMALPVDDGSGDIDWTGSIDRHIEKTLASNTINFVGSVNTAEKIEIYAYT